jgi:hypothetical protein
VLLRAFKHRNSPFELFLTKYGFDIGLMDLHEILLFFKVKGQGHRVKFFRPGDMSGFALPLFKNRI